MVKFISLIVFVSVVIGCGLHSGYISSSLEPAKIEAPCSKKVCHIHQEKDNSLKLSFSSTSFENQTFIIGQCRENGHNCELLGRLSCDADQTCLSLGSHSIIDVKKISPQTVEVTFNTAKKVGMNFTIE